MQRNTLISRSRVGEFRAIGVAGSPAHQSSTQIFDVLERRLSKRHRQLFAEPVSEGRSGDIDWWSDLTGPVEPVEDLSPDEQAALRDEIETMLSEIRETANALVAANRGDSALIGELLLTAMTSPAPTGLFRVGGQPVLTLWAHEPQTSQVAPVIAPAATAAAAAAPVDAAFAEVADDPPPEEKPRAAWAIPAWLRWLLLLLLLLLLLFFLLRACAPDDLGIWPEDEPVADIAEEPVDPEPDALEDRPLEEPVAEDPDTVVVTPDIADDGDTIVVVPDGDAPVDGTVDTVIVVLEEELNAERDREEELRRRIALLEAQIAAEQRRCDPDICGEEPLQSTPEAPPVSPPVEEPVIEETPVEESPPEEAVIDPPPPEEEVVEEEVVEEQAIEEPPPPPAPEPETRPVSCPEERQPWEAPEVVVVFDSSGSMALDKSVRDSEIDDLMRRAQAGDLSAIRALDALNGAPGERRIDVAKDALYGLIDGLPQDVDIGYIEFGSCESVVNHQFYSSAQRPALKGLISATEPDEGTPLARALERAGNIIKGRTSEDEGVIVLVSDGYGTCGGDACAVARQIAAEKPGVTINVVTLGQNEDAQCIARAGRGKVIDGEGRDLQDAIFEASEQAPVPPECQ